MLNNDAFEAFPPFIQNCIQSGEFPKEIGVGVDVLSLEWHLEDKPPYLLVKCQLPDEILCEIEGETYAQLIGFRFTVPPKESKGNIIEIAPYLQRKVIVDHNGTIIS